MPDRGGHVGGDIGGRQESAFASARWRRFKIGEGVEQRCDDIGAASRSLRRCREAVAKAPRSAALRWIDGCVQCNARGEACFCCWIKSGARVCKQSRRTRRQRWINAFKAFDNVTGKAVNLGLERRRNLIADGEQTGDRALSKRKRTACSRRYDRAVDTQTGKLTAGEAVIRSNRSRCGEFDLPRGSSNQKDAFIRDKIDFTTVALDFAYRNFF